MASRSKDELRHRAEHRLRQKPAAGAGVPADPHRLLQELQIHQIELELQNEELKQAKAEVETALEKYADLYDFAPVGYFSLDEQGLILEVNLTGSALLGIERSHLTSRRFQLFVAPAVRVDFNAFLKRALASYEAQTCEISLLRAGRAAFWAELQAVASAAGGRKWCRMAIIVIAERKRAEEAQRRVEFLGATNRRLEEEIVRRQAGEAALKKSERRARHLLEQSRHLQEKLRLMSRQILLGQEEQRKEISRALHDEISQQLLGLNVHLAIFAKAPAMDPAAMRRTIARVRRLVKKSVRVVHQFARDLRPAMLDDLGLVPALRSYVNEFPKRKGRQIQFTAFAGPEALDNDVRTVLYRVAQEALTNVAKHAQASLVKVNLRKSKSAISLEIADDGKAFKPERLSSRECDDRLGLVGMRERVEMVRGRLTILSAPGVGTIIRAEVPLGKKTLAPGGPDPPSR